MAILPNTENSRKISTLNLCLGLKNKNKYIINKIIHELKIDIYCIQEVELPIAFPIEGLTIKTLTLKWNQMDYNKRSSMSKR
jgi:hypothetical protein